MTISGLASDRAMVIAADGYRVEMVGRAALVEPSAWDDLARDAGGDVFSSHAWHSAVEEAPPGRMEPAHLLAYRGSELVGLCPAYLVHRCPRLEYAFSDLEGPVLLCHGLAALTGGSLVRVGHEGVRSLLDRGLERAARELRAWAYGYANLTPGRFTGELLGRGYALADLATSYRLLGDWKDAAGYWSSLSRRHRQNLRRERVRCLDAGFTVREEPAPSQAVRLVHGLLADRGTPAEVLPEAFLRAVVRHLTPHDRTVVARDPGGEPCAVFLSWRFGRWKSLWVAGLDTARLRVFRPYHAMLATAIETTIAEGVGAVDLGRANGSVKRRYGARPVPLALALRSGRRDRDALLHLWCRDLQRRSNAVLNGLETSSRCC